MYMGQCSDKWTWKIRETDKLTDMAENKTNCTGDLCGTAWKPTSKNDISEDKE